MILYSLDIGNTIGRDGVYTFERSGQAVDISGQLYVDLGHSMIPAGSRWHATQELAYMEAAKKLAEMARTLDVQAKRLAQRHTVGFSDEF